LSPLIALRIPGCKKHLVELIHDEPDVRRAALPFEALSPAVRSREPGKVKVNCFALVAALCQVLMDVFVFRQ